MKFIPVFWPKITKIRFKMKPHIFFYFRDRSKTLNSKSAVITIFGGIRNRKLKVDFIETKGIQLRRRPSSVPQSKPLVSMKAPLVSISDPPKIVKPQIYW